MEKNGEILRGKNNINVEKQEIFKQLLQNRNLHELWNFVGEICDLPLFQRLQDISYFGSGEYFYTPPYRYTRYQHCINTAYYTALCLFSHHCSEDDLRTGIIWGLTHDLGHIIFSHTGEEALRQKEHFDHETFSEELLQNTAFHKIFARYEITHQSLTEFKTHFWFMCDSHFDIDTLCGITDFAQVFRMIDFPLTQLLTEGLQKQDGMWIWIDHARPLIQAFWQLKARVYREYVYVLENEACDLMIQRIIQLSGFSDKLIGEHEFLTNLHKQPNSTAALLWNKIESRQFWQLDKKSIGDEVEIMEKCFQAFKSSDLPKNISWADLHAFLDKRYKKQWTTKYLIK